MSKTCRLQTFVSAGEVFKLPGSNELHILPMQLMRMRSGMTVLRIGDMTYWFDENGEYDGPEMVFPDGISDEKAEEVRVALERCRNRRDTRPASAYFHEGCDGYDAEVGAWPAVARN